MANPYTRKEYKRVRQGYRDGAPEEIRVLSPSRGLNELGDDFMIDNKDASDLLNIKFTENGIIEKRDGYIIEGDELTAIPTGLGVFITNTDDFLMAIDGGVLKKLVNYVWTDVSSSKHLTVNSSVFTTSVNSKFFVWDGIGLTPNTAAGQAGGGCLIYDGSSTVAGQKCPKARFSIVYKDYHFASGVDGQPYRVYMSGLNEPDRFTRAATVSGSPVQLNTWADVPGATVFSGDNSPNAFDVNRYDGEKVTGFGFFQDALIIFKEQSIWQMTLNEQSLPVITRITNAYGCVAHGSIATVENDCYFLFRDGVYVLGNEPNFYAAIRTNQLSARIQNTISRINTAAYDKVRALFFNYRYHLAVPLDTEVNNNTMLVYDKRFYAWSVWDIPASGLATHLDTSNRLNMVFTSSQNKSLNRFTPNVYNDNGLGISAWWRSRAFHGRKIEYMKWWRQFRPIFKGLNGSVTISFYDEDGEFDASDEYQINPALSGGLGSYLFGDAVFGGGTPDDYISSGSGNGSGTAGHHVSNTNNSKPMYIFINHESRTFSFQVENHNADENFSLLGFVLQFETKDFSVADGDTTYLR